MAVNCLESQLGSELLSSRCSLVVAFGVLVKAHIPIAGRFLGGWPWCWQHIHIGTLDKEGRTLDICNTNNYLHYLRDVEVVMGEAWVPGRIRVGAGCLNLKKFGASNLEKKRRSTEISAACYQCLTPRNARKGPMLSSYLNNRRPSPCYVTTSPIGRFVLKPPELRRIERGQ